MTQEEKEIGVFPIYLARHRYKNTQLILFDNPERKEHLLFWLDTDVVDKFGRTGFNCYRKTSWDEVGMLINRNELEFYTSRYSCFTLKCAYIRGWFSLNNERYEGYDMLDNYGHY